MKEKQIRIVKWIIFMFIIGIFIYSIACLFPLVKEILTPEGQFLFQEKIMNTGINGALLLFGLEFAQIFFVILPGEPLEILAGMCYGTLGGTLFILGSVFLITTMIVLLVKKFGKKIVYEFFSKEKVDKIEKSKVFNNPKQIEWIMLILFFIPGTPKDLLVYIGGLLPIKPSKFIFISTFGRFPSIISSTIAGNNLVNGKWGNIALVYLITFLLVIFVFFLIHLFDKNHQTKEAFDTIK